MTSRPLFDGPPSVYGAPDVARGGAAFAGDIPGLVSGYRFSDGELVAGPTLHETDVTSGDRNAGLLWLHFSLADRQGQSWLGRNLGLPAAAVELLTSHDDHQIIRRIGNAVCGIVAGLSQELDAETDDSVRLSFVLTDRLLVTARHRPVQSVQRLREKVAAGLSVEDPGWLLVELMLNFVDRIEAIGDRLGDELEAIEDRVLDNRPVDQTGRIAPIRQIVARQHRLLRNFRRAILRFSHDRGVVEHDRPIPIAHLTERLELVDTEFDELANRARLLHDEALSKLAGQSNRILFVLSVLTALFLPPTLVTGFFGMNFTWMPLIESAGGVWVAATACLVSSVAVLFFLRLISKR